MCQVFFFSFRPLLLNLFCRVFLILWLLNFGATLSSVRFFFIYTFFFFLYIHSLGCIKVLNIPKFVSPFWYLSLELKTCLFNCILNISTWKCNRYVKLNVPKLSSWHSTPLTSSLPPCSPDPHMVFLISTTNFSNCSDRNLGIILTPLFLSHLTSNQ